MRSLLSMSQTIPASILRPGEHVLAALRREFTTSRALGQRRPDQCIQHAFTSVSVPFYPLNENAGRSIHFFSIIFEKFFRAFPQ